jgi:hypothetical protein
MNHADSDDGRGLCVRWCFEVVLAACVVVQLWWCSCGGAVVVGAVVVVQLWWVQLWWCSCGGAVVVVA